MDTAVTTAPVATSGSTLAPVDTSDSTPVPVDTSDSTPFDPISPDPPGNLCSRISNTTPTATAPDTHPFPHTESEIDTILAELFGEIDNSPFPLPNYDNSPFPPLPNHDYFPFAPLTYAPPTTPIPNPSCPTCVASVQLAPPRPGSQHPQRPPTPKLPSHEERREEQRSALEEESEYLMERRREAEVDFLMRDVRIAELDRMLEKKWKRKSEAEEPDQPVAKPQKRRRVNSKASMRITKKKRHPRGEKSYSQMTEKEADERARERYRLAGLI